MPVWGQPSTWHIGGEDTLDVELRAVLVEELGPNSRDTRDGAHGRGLQASEQKWHCQCQGQHD